MMDFSIVIPVTREDYLDECLNSLLQMDYDRGEYEIILLVGEELKLPGKFAASNIKQIIVADRNPALRRNTGVREASGDIIVFIDDDVTVVKDYLKNAKKEFGLYPDISGMGGPDYIPPGSTFREKITDALLAHKYFGSGVLAHTYYKKTRVIKGPSEIALCNLFIKKEVFNKMLFNERIGYGGEDTEFLYLIQKRLGARLLYSPEIFVYHKKRKFGMDYLRQRLRFRINNGKMLYVYPGMYLKNVKFFMFFFGFTLGLVLLVINPRVFLYAFTIYLSLLLISSIGLVKKDPRLFLLLPFLLALQHVIYYLGIVIGLFSVFEYPGLREIRR